MLVYTLDEFYSLQDVQNGSDMNILKMALMCLTETLWGQYEDEIW